jgi:outer membrane protein TolC
MKRKNIAFGFIFFLLPMGVMAQDSTKVLTELDFLAAVRQYHPVAKQGSLLVDDAKARLLSARGAFDPMLVHRTDRKTFDEKNYFNYVKSEMVVPTWFGIEGYAGLERNSGSFQNTELTSGRSSYAGISIPLVKDLVLDTRRAVLRQASLFVRQSEAERNLLVNDLLRDASFLYWNWARDFQLVHVIDEVLKVNEQRYALIKISFQEGDRAPIDTTEALAQLQSFQQQRAEAYLKYQKSTLELSTFLWLPNEQPAYLSQDVIPDTSLMKQPTPSSGPTLTEWINTSLGTHPKLKQLELKISGLTVERKLKFQSLLPQADFKYQFLQPGYEPWKGIGLNFFENNFKYGFRFSIPIPNRKGWGDYRAARIKIKATELEQSFTRIELENKLRYHFTEVGNLREQVQAVESAYINYIRLLDAEKLRFSLGETTLFLLNTRENKALETMQKLLELKAKSFQSVASLNWAAGQMR